MKFYLFDFLYWTWCLPQTIVGLLFHIIFILLNIKTCKRFHYKNTVVLLIKWFPLEAVSFGKYIICGDNKNKGFDSLYMKELIKHEYGHTKQSIILGLFYLFVIELPGFIWACFHNGKEDYFTFYTEHWANKLGKVDETLV